MADIDRARQILRDITREAKKAGADKAVASLHASRAASAGVRRGTTETATRSVSLSYGVRVFTGDRSAVIYANETAPDCAEIAARALAGAKAVPADPFAGMPDREKLAPGQDGQAAKKLFSAELTAPETLIKRALEAEEAALSHQGITNSEGAEADASVICYALCRDDGYENIYARPYFGVSACVIAGEGGAMERDYAYASATEESALTSPAVIGNEAARRTLRRMNAKKPASGKYTLVYEPRMARALLGHFLQAVNGASVARGASFLKDATGERIFREGIHVTHAPSAKGGLQSRPFDAEGMPAGDIALIEDGILRSFLLDTRSAAKLGTASNGCASGGIDPHPAAFNPYLSAGKDTPEALIQSVEKGVLITDGFGGGVNPVTGDYSQGLAGLLIENGEIKGAVHEMTAAGNLRDMFARLVTANDLAFRYSANAPTVVIEDMAVAGT